MTNSLGISSLKKSNYTNCNVKMKKNLNSKNNNGNRMDESAIKVDAHHLKYEISIINKKYSNIIKDKRNDLNNNKCDDLSLKISQQDSNCIFSLLENDNYNNNNTNCYSYNKKNINVSNMSSADANGNNNNLNNKKSDSKNILNENFILTKHKNCSVMSFNKINTSSKANGVNSTMQHDNSKNNSYLSNSVVHNLCGTSSINNLVNSCNSNTNNNNNINVVFCNNNNNNNNDTNNNNNHNNNKNKNGNHYLASYETKSTNNFNINPSALYQNLTYNYTRHSDNNKSDNYNNFLSSINFLNSNLQKSNNEEDGALNNNIKKSKISSISKRNNSYFFNTKSTSTFLMNSSYSASAALECSKNNNDLNNIRKNEVCFRNNSLQNTHSNSNARCYNANIYDNNNKFIINTNENVNLNVNADSSANITNSPSSFSSLILNREFSFSTDSISKSLCSTPNIISSSLINSRTLSESELGVFRTRLCVCHQNGLCKNSDSCPHSHCLTWHRRNPYLMHYLPKLCPEIEFIKKGTKMNLVRRCNKGRACIHAHSKEEELYHPLVYKTKICSTFPQCSRYFCPFAHSEGELRSPMKTQPVNLFNYNTNILKKNVMNNNNNNVSNRNDKNNLNNNNNDLISTSLIEMNTNNSREKGKIKSRIMYSNKNLNCKFFYNNDNGKEKHVKIKEKLHHVEHQEFLFNNDIITHVKHKNNGISDVEHINTDKLSSYVQNNKVKDEKKLLAIAEPPALFPCPPSSMSCFNFSSSISSFFSNYFSINKNIQPLSENNYLLKSTDGLHNCKHSASCSPMCVETKKHKRLEISKENKRKQTNVVSPKIVKETKNLELVSKEGQPSNLEEKKLNGECAVQSLMYIVEEERKEKDNADLFLYLDVVNCFPHQNIFIGDLENNINGDIYNSSNVISSDFKYKSKNNKIINKNNNTQKILGSSNPFFILDINLKDKVEPERFNNSSFLLENKSEIDKAQCSENKLIFETMSFPSDLCVAEVESSNDKDKRNFNINCGNLNINNNNNSETYNKYLVNNIKKEKRCNHDTNTEKMYSFSSNRAFSSSDSAECELFFPNSVSSPDSFSKPNMCSFILDNNTSYKSRESSQKHRNLNLLFVQKRNELCCNDYNFNSKVEGMNDVKNDTEKSNNIQSETIDRYNENNKAVSEYNDLSKGDSSKQGVPISLKCFHDEQVMIEERKESKSSCKLRNKNDSSDNAKYLCSNKLEKNFSNDDNMKNNKSDGIATEELAEHLIFPELEKEISTSFSFSKSNCSTFNASNATTQDNFIKGAFVGLPSCCIFCYSLLKSLCENNVGDEAEQNFFKSNRAVEEAAIRSKSNFIVGSVSRPSVSFFPSSSLSENSPNLYQDNYYDDKLSTQNHNHVCNAMDSRDCFNCAPSSCSHLELISSTYNHDYKIHQSGNNYTGSSNLYYVDNFNSNGVASAILYQENRLIFAFAKFLSELFYFSLLFFVFFVMEEKNKSKSTTLGRINNNVDNGCENECNRHKKNRFEPSTQSSFYCKNYAHNEVGNNVMNSIYVNSINNNDSINSKNNVSNTDNSYIADNKNYDSNSNENYNNTLNATYTCYGDNNNKYYNYNNAPLYHEMLNYLFSVDLRNIPTKCADLVLYSKILSYFSSFLTHCNSVSCSNSFLFSSICSPFLNKSSSTSFLSSCGIKNKNPSYEAKMLSKENSTVSSSPQEIKQQEEENRNSDKKEMEQKVMEDHDINNCFKEENNEKYHCFNALSNPLLFAVLPFLFFLPSLQSQSNQHTDCNNLSADQSVCSHGSVNKGNNFCIEKDYCNRFKKNENTNNFCNFSSNDQVFKPLDLSFNELDKVNCSEKCSKCNVSVHTENKHENFQKKEMQEHNKSDEFFLIEDVLGMYEEGKEKNKKEITLKDEMLKSVMEYNANVCMTCCTSLPGTIFNENDDFYCCSYPTMSNYIDECTAMHNIIDSAQEDEIIEENQVDMKVKEIDQKQKVSNLISCETIEDQTLKENEHCTIEKLQEMPCNTNRQYILEGKNKLKKESMQTNVVSSSSESHNGKDKYLVSNILRTNLDTHFTSFFPYNIPFQENNEGLAIISAFDGTNNKYELNVEESKCIFLNSNNIFKFSNQPKKNLKEKKEKEKRVKNTYAQCYNNPHNYSSNFSCFSSSSFSSKFFSNDFSDYSKKFNNKNFEYRTKLRNNECKKIIEKNCFCQDKESCINNNVNFNNLSLKSCSMNNIIKGVSHCNNNVNFCRKTKNGSNKNSDSDFINKSINNCCDLKVNGQKKKRNLCKNQICKSRDNNFVESNSAINYNNGIRCLQTETNFLSSINRKCCKLISTHVTNNNSFNDNSFIEHYTNNSKLKSIVKKQLMRNSIYENISETCKISEVKNFNNGQLILNSNADSNNFSCFATKFAKKIALNNDTNKTKSNISAKQDCFVSNCDNKLNEKMESIKKNEHSEILDLIDYNNIWHDITIKINHFSNN